MVETQIQADTPTEAPTIAESRPTLSKAQKEAVRALLEGASVTGAARQADVTRQTVSYWRRNNPTFRAALAAGWREIRLLTYGRVFLLSEQALDTLRDVMQDAPDSRSRVRAAELILQYAGERLKPAKEEVRDYYLDFEDPAEDDLTRYEGNFTDPWWIPRPEKAKG